MRVPEKLPDINKSRYDLPVVGPFCAIVEGAIEVPWLSALGVVTSWTYLVEYFYPEVVVPRNFELASVSLKKIYQKGLLGAYNQAQQYSDYWTSTNNEEGTVLQEPVIGSDGKADEVGIVGDL